MKSPVMSMWQQLNEKMVTFVRNVVILNIAKGESLIPDVVPVKYTMKVQQQERYLINVNFLFIRISILYLNLAQRKKDIFIRVFK